MTMEQLLQYLIENKASDLHLLAGLPPAARLHGELTPIKGAEALTGESIQKLAYSILTPAQIERFEHDPETRNELDFAYGVPQLGRFRFNVYRQRGTVGCVVRALASSIPEFQSLGLPPAAVDLTDVRKGLSLVTGPTGSGKSTTLASMIDLINSTRRDHIITIEDPIEYVHNSKMSYVSQREVGDSGDTLSFRNALKYALRQDPDVILIGEMRDHETIGIAITSAETGHLVFGTLHTSSAAQTIGRIIDVFPSDQAPQVVVQLAANLVGVLSQILLPTVDGQGRVVACELMKANSAIRNLIRGNNVDGINQSIQTSAKNGMVTMDQSIFNLVKTGKVSCEVALPYVREEVTRRQLEPYKGRGTAMRSSVAGASASAAVAAADSLVDSVEEKPAESTEAKPANEEPTRRSTLLGGIPPWEKK